MEEYVEHSLIRECPILVNHMRRCKDCIEGGSFHELCLRFVDSSLLSIRLIIVDEGTPDPTQSCFPFLIGSRYNCSKNFA